MGKYLAGNLTDIVGKGVSVASLPHLCAKMLQQILDSLGPNSTQDAIKRIGFIRNANVKLRQEQVGSGALWIKPVERNRPVKLLRLSMGIVTRTDGCNGHGLTWVMQ